MLFFDCFEAKMSDLGMEKIKGRRGGRRQGSGAPQGNFNALKHGRYSHRLRDALYWTIERRMDVISAAKDSFNRRYHPPKSPPGRPHQGTAHLQPPST